MKEIKVNLEKYGTVDTTIVEHPKIIVKKT
jgi:hypothetical protein